jgi:hypothetical protein
MDNILLISKFNMILNIFPNVLAVIIVEYLETVDEIRAIDDSKHLELIDLYNNSIKTAPIFSKQWMPEVNRLAEAYQRLRDNIVTVYFTEFKCKGKQAQIEINLFMDKYKKILDYRNDDRRLLQLPTAEETKVITIDDYLNVQPTYDAFTSEYAAISESYKMIDKAILQKNTQLDEYFHALYPNNPKKANIERGIYNQYVNDSNNTIQQGS